MATLCICCRIADTPTSPATQNHLTLNAGNPKMTKDDAVCHKTTMSGFDRSSRVKKNALLAGIWINKLLTPASEVHRLNTCLSEPQFIDATHIHRFTQFPNTATFNNPPCIQLISRFRYDMYGLT